MSISTALKRLSIATAGAVTIALTTASTASAASITFDFSGSGGQQNSFSQTEDGLGVTATGETRNGNSRDVFQGSGGFGVTRGPGESNQIDGQALAFKETLNLSFDNIVTLLSATFTDVDSGDDFKLFVDGTQLVSNQIPGLGSGTFDFTNVNATGTVLGFSVGEDADNEYFLKSVEVKEVPEPTTILGSLLVSGFGAMFYKKRKNQSDITA